MVVFGPPPNLFQEGVSHVDYDEHKGVLTKVPYLALAPNEFLHSKMCNSQIYNQFIVLYSMCCFPSQPLSRKASI